MMLGRIAAAVLFLLLFNSLTYIVLLRVPPAAGAAWGLALGALLLLSLTLLTAGLAGFLWALRGQRRHARAASDSGVSEPEASQA
ncbi:MAG: hypothetical protein ACODAE_10040 [Gemmatimonadota bacterium]